MPKNQTTALKTVGDRFLRSKSAKNGGFPPFFWQRSTGRNLPIAIYSFRNDRILRQLPIAHKKLSRAANRRATTLGLAHKDHEHVIHLLTQFQDDSKPSSCIFGAFSLQLFIR